MPPIRHIRRRRHLTDDQQPSASGHAHQQANPPCAQPAGSITLEHVAIFFGLRVEAELCGRRLADIARNNGAARTVLSIWRGASSALHDGDTNVLIAVRTP
jgi:hypothetical protein